VKLPVSNLNLPEQIDLQLALIFIGAVIIISIVIYNLARSNKSKLKRDQQASLATSFNSAANTPSTTQNFDVNPHDELGSESGRKEPSLGNLATFKSPADDSATSEDGVKTPAFNDAVRLVSDLIPIEPFKPTQYVSRIDPNIDCVVAFRFVLPVNGSEIIECIQKLSKNDSFRIAFEGLTETSSYTGSLNSSWELIQFNNLYRELQASIQLANRRGPLEAEQLAEFIGLVQKLSQELDAEIDIPPVNDILNDATDLDQFAIQCDIQLGFNLTSNMMSWQCTEIQNALINSGFVLSREGSSFNYMLNDVLLFKVQVANLNFLRDDLQAARVNQIYFSFDVPLISKQLDPFIKMLEVGQILAQKLDGRLLDDNGQVLSILLTQNIQNQLQPIYQLMQQRQIEPGSPSALRLFN